MQSIKFNKASKIACAVLTVLLLALTPIFFAGCSSSITMKDFTSNAENAAKEYFANHINYDKFADTTFVTEETSKESETFELEYKNKASDAEATKHNVTNSFEKTTTKTLSIKNIGNEAKDISVALKIVEKTTTVENSRNNDQTLHTEKTEITVTTIYNVAPKTDATGTTYYITKQVTSTEPNSEEVKEYRVIDDAVYKEAVGMILSEINNEFVIDGYFSMVSQAGMMYGNLLNITKDGDTVKAAIEMKSFNVQKYNNYEVADMEMKMHLSFNGKQLGTIYSEMTQTAGNSTAIMINKANVKYTAEITPVIADIADYEENDELTIEEDELPETEIGFAS